MSHITDFLESMPLFSGMSGLELNAVSAFLEPRHVASGDAIFREGETGQELFLVRTGKVGSYVTQADGERREIYEHLPGSLFGEMAIIESEPRSATCYAKEEVDLLVLEAIDFYRLVWEHPIIGVKLLSSMARVMVSWLDEASGFLGGLVRWGETARRRAIADDLSGLFNRRFLEETVRLRFSRGSSNSRTCALLMLDIDRFREINAAYGPQAGDAVISSAATAFGALLSEGEIAARLSGDEFAFFLPGAGKERAVALAERIRAEAEGLWIEFRTSRDKPPERVAITVSLGVAWSPEIASGAEELLGAADRALYRAKEEGRNRVCTA
ncbi:MAG TPA: GGDEF domain-containing protein [Rectinemataceae bacterium]|nr:GGDEF domain-containing protein [Rectinemataceae bacterium]